MASARFDPGDVVEIPDCHYAMYYAVIACDGDVLFFDRYSAGKEVALKDERIFLRLPVSAPSMRRGRWRKIDNIAPTGEIATIGRYLLTPVGAQSARL